eukprot:gene4921-biopygen23549
MVTATVCRSSTYDNVASGTPKNCVAVMSNLKSRGYELRRAPMPGDERPLCCGVQVNAVVCFESIIPHDTERIFHYVRPVSDAL